MADILGFVMLNPDVVSVLFVAAVAISVLTFFVMQKMPRFKGDSADMKARVRVEQIEATVYGTNTAQGLEAAVTELRQKVASLTAGEVLPTTEVKRKERIKELPQMKAEEVSNLLRAKVIEAIQNANLGIELNVAFDEKLEVRPSGTLKIKTPEPLAPVPKQPKIPEEGEGVGT